MKRLILVRHGKSSWKENLPDKERPLKKRAYKDAGLVINEFGQFQSTPLVMWSSPAVRALTTAKLFKEELEVLEENFVVKEELYTFDKKDLLAIIRTCDDSVDNLIVFGHNPAMTNLVNFLGDQNFDNVPTTGLTVIEFDTSSWKGVKNGKTLLYLFPKNLR